MYYKDNAFFILGASPRDHRRKIVSLCEEKALYAETENLVRAQDALLNPQKRIEQELTWFPGISAKVAAEICQSIHTDQLIAFRSDTPIIAFGVQLWNLAHRNYSDYLKMGYDIIALDEKFSAIEAEQCRDLLNADRLIAGFAQIESNRPIEEGLLFVRNTAKSIIADMLKKLQDSDYIELVTLICEKCIAVTCESGEILDDLVGDYELAMQPELDRRAEIIIRQSQLVWAASPLVLHKDEQTLMEQFGRVSGPLSELISFAMEWDRIAQPVQVVAQAKGIKHAQSIQIAVALRDLAIHLHNDCNEIISAMHLTFILSVIFAELPEFSELINEDMQTLDQIALSERFVEYASETNMEYHVDIKSDSVSIPKFCICCLQPTAHTEKRRFFSAFSGNLNTGEIDMPLCEDCAQNKKTAYNALQAKQKRYRDDVSARVKRASVPMVLVSIVAPLVLASILYLSGADQSLCIWLCLLLPGFVALIWGSSIKLERKVPGYSKYCPHVNIGSSDDLLRIRRNGANTFLFCFFNGMYAELFARANGSTVVKKKASTDRNEQDRVFKDNLFKSGQSTASIWAVIIAASIIMAIGFGNVQHSDAITNTFLSGSAVTSGPKPTPTSYDAPVVSFPSNGTPKYDIDDEPLAPLTIETSSDSGKYYYVVLTNTATGEKAVALYVHGGESVEISVPLGKYSLYCAVGDVWYGEKDLFGPSGAYGTWNKILDFYDAGICYDGYSITLEGKQMQTVDAALEAIFDRISRFKTQKFAPEPEWPKPSFPPFVFPENS